MRNSNNKPKYSLAACDRRLSGKRFSVGRWLQSNAAGEALAISIPGGEARVIRHFQERMPYGLFVPNIP
jgi:hypothetical protein